MDAIVSLFVKVVGPAAPTVDYVAIAGIMGTLLGTALGAFVTWKVQKQQLAHEDITRFHDRRLTIYSDFTSAASGVVTAIMVGKSNRLEEMKAAVLSYELLRLVASDPVLLAAELVHAAMVKITNTPAPIPDELSNEFNQLVRKFLSEARQEIGVGKYQ